MDLIFIGLAAVLVIVVLIANVVIKKIAPAFAQSSEYKQIKNTLISKGITIPIGIVLFFVCCYTIWTENGADTLSTMLIYIICLIGYIVGSCIEMTVNLVVSYRKYKKRLSEAARHE